ncbi:PQQ-like beta-propeller repeat protein, partial [candidate division WOR-3 bacterium]|nr:PQQ-like beta-propeller repeat protein [candidate division WOR-3 bacterium]
MGNRFVSSARSVVALAAGVAALLSASCSSHYVYPQIPEHVPLFSVEVPGSHVSAPAIWETHPAKAYVNVQHPELPTGGLFEWPDNWTVGFKPNPEPILQGWQGSSTAPVVREDGHVLVTTQLQEVLCCTPDGRAVSNADASPPSGVLCKTPEGDPTGVAAAGDTAFYVCTQALSGEVARITKVRTPNPVDDLYGIARQSTEEAWSVYVSAPSLTAPVVGPDGFVYAGGSDGVLYAVDPATQEVHSLSTNADEPLLSPPSFDDKGRAYFGTAGGRLYVASGATAGFSVIDVFPPTGEPLAPICASPAIGRGERSRSELSVYFGCDDGRFRAVRFDGSNFSDPWTYPPAGQTTDFGPIRTCPALSSAGRVYFGTSGGYFVALNTDGSLAWQEQVLTPEQTPVAVLSSPTILPCGIFGLIVFGAEDMRLRFIADAG